MIWLLFMAFEALSTRKFFAKKVLFAGLATLFPEYFPVFYSKRERIAAAGRFSLCFRMLFVYYFHECVLLL